MKNTSDMSPLNSKKIKELAKRFGIYFILLFGSKAEGTDSADSDTDIAVYGDHILSEEEKIALIYELTEIFQTEKIDIVDIKTAPPLLKKKIFDNYRPFFVKDKLLLYQIELSTFQEYEETKILRQIRDERLKDFASDR